MLYFTTWLLIRAAVKSSPYKNISLNIVFFVNENNEGKKEMGDGEWEKGYEE